MATQDYESLTLHSTFKEIERLEPYLKNVLKQTGFDDSQFDRIRLAVNEAVTNAIVHGNKEDPSKKVHISVSKQSDLLQVEVKDEGSGFDPSSLPDPLDEENLLKESGRGIFLIKEYADEVEFYEGGTKLAMRFELKNN